MKKRALLKDLEESRRRQFKDKANKIAEEAKFERDLALKTREAQQQAEEMERRLNA